MSIGSIHVINKTRGSATITDDKGRFEIYSSINDTLLFSAIQFRVKIIVVNNQILKSKEIVVPLESFVNRLSEVIVKPHNLSGDLYKDFENSGVKPINFYNSGIPGFAGTRKEKIITKKQLIISTLLLPLTGSIPIEPIYKHISGYYKTLKKKRKLDTEFDVVANLIKFYGVDFFVETYELKEDEVYEFVSGTYENFPLRQSFKRNEHNLVMEYFEKNQIRVINK
tara:strand:+ start:886 stop:1560 length:675 start_codon:yes stop_codon:yes gene_type:complete